MQTFASAEHSAAVICQDHWLRGEKSYCVGLSVKTESPPCRRFRSRGRMSGVGKSKDEYPSPQARKTDTLSKKAMRRSHDEDESCVLSVPHVLTALGYTVYLTSNV